ncbi:MAG: GAF domain-containing protein, partial [Anaerolineales bacterium]
VARERQAEIINDTEGSAIYLFDPRLPNTRAEAAFPMLVSDELVGVLDLQSETVGRFQEGEAQILSTLAEQIAIAVRNAQLYRQQEHVAQELERAD